MPDPEEIRIDNLRVALQQLQGALAFGLGSAIFVLLLVWATPRLTETEQLVEIPILLFSAEPVIAGTIAMAVYVVSGLAAGFMAWRARTIVASIEQPELKTAALMYPSIGTAHWVIRILAAVLPALLILFAAVVEGVLFSPYTLAGLVVIMAPYLLLAFLLLKPLDEEAGKYEAR